ncbi:phage neck terminator protein [Acinetobacter guillouiae]|uniref:phage neck terminator protein n=1 Tax=Acinetobacter guillouiae TaxID=106649 RepID=UPI003C6FEDE9
MGDSASGGYITPTGGSAYDQELEDIFQAFIVGITSLPGLMVRPRFQKDPPPMPAIGVDWCAFAVKSIIPDDGPYFDQQDETMDSIRHEELTLFLSFYGDHGQSIANVLKDGLAIPQNIAQLKAQQIKFISTGEIITAPDFLNNQYVHRYDLTAVFKRKTSRTFAVKSLVDAGKIKLNQE